VVARIIDPSLIAQEIRKELLGRVKQLKRPLKLVGFLSTDASPSQTYANYTQAACNDVGIGFELRRVGKLELERAIDEANLDPDVHGIIVYYPIFGTEHDAYIKDLVDHRKDIEGLGTHWVRKLYHNDRYIDEAKTKKAILPCTPLAAVKLLDAAGAMTHVPGQDVLKGKVVTIFNRSEVVGRPLASMLSNDGAEVFSFDIDGPLLFKKKQISETSVTRVDALAQSDIVVTGVPSRSFPLVKASEIRAGAICINFSTLKNFDEDILEKAGVFVPRVGPMTVTMAMRNTLRLYDNFHS
jgi:5,10-methylene-tetrahydrofolate dehydrogenase/methenyl tetrahydrofolate cyclohydrolase